MKALPKDLRYLLFDLDGTLTDSAEGILRCVQYALEQCGTPEPDAEKLRPFIGPPLHVTFPETVSAGRYYNFLDCRSFFFHLDRKIT